MKTQHLNKHKTNTPKTNLRSRQQAVSAASAKVSSPTVKGISTYGVSSCPTTYTKSSKVSKTLLVTLSCGILAGLAAVWWTQGTNNLSVSETIKLEAIGVSEEPVLSEAKKKEVHTIQAPLYNEPMEVSNEVVGGLGSAVSPNIPPSLEAPISTQAPLPRGFGLEEKETLGAESSASDSTAAPTAKSDTSSSMVGGLEEPTPTGSEVTQSESADKTGTGLVEAIDPREIGVSVNDGPEKDYEETALSVQRTLTAVMDDGDKQLIRMKVPVMYLSRTLRLENDQEQRARQILASLKTKKEELSKIKTELDAILVQWNSLVESGSPSQVLMPESPSLPANQSLGDINREDNPELEPGKAITYEVVGEDKR